MNKILLYLVCLIAICAQTHTPLAQSLPFSTTEAEAIKSAWGKSTLPRMMICGDRTVGMWKKFPKNFFQGVPKRGFLITPPMLSQDFKHTFRTTTDYNKLACLLIALFTDMKLISVDESFQHVDIFSNGKVEIHIPKQLHECLLDKEKAWGCGVAEAKEKECCEKGLGSPKIEIIWNDLIRKETIKLIYRSTMGGTKLIRTTENREDIYFCITTESFDVN